jgi:hypothetical protein
LQDRRADGAPERAPRRASARAAQPQTRPTPYRPGAPPPNARRRVSARQPTPKRTHPASARYPTRKPPAARPPGRDRPAAYNAAMSSTPETTARSWLRCYRCWSQDLEVQVHYEGIHKIDPDTGERSEVVDELQEAVVQCLDCMHDQPHLGFNNGRVEPIEDRWERMIAGTPWVASCTVSVDAEDVETCSGPEAGDALSYAAFGDYGVREFFTHVRFHKHEDDAQIVVHLLVELYARSLEEATEVLEQAARGDLTITSLAEESRPPASSSEPHGAHE